MNEKLFFIEFRSCEGTIGKRFGEVGFIPDRPDLEWYTYRILRKNKKNAIKEMIAKLECIKDK